MGATMPVVVDTDVVSFLFKSHPLAPAYQAILAGRPLAVSLITLAEIEYGMEVKNWGANRRDLMHRFLRVWRRSGWKMWELDLLLTNATINPDALGPKTLARLYRVARLQRTTGLGIDQLAAFYGVLRRFTVGNNGPLDILFRRTSWSPPLAPTLTMLGATLATAIAAIWLVGLLWAAAPPLDGGGGAPSPRPAGPTKSPPKSC